MNCNEEGFLSNPNDWNEDVAEQLAAQDQFELNDDHFEILHLVRKFYTDYEHSPAMRPLVKFISKELGKDKGNSIYLMKLFPGSPAKFSAKYAGIPKPDKCL